ncbi:MAG: hypothetical protein KA802_18055 [Saprospiraceae bacterium]|nr:hypothetical protein [Saprospiraceae bacterium]
MTSSIEMKFKPSKKQFEAWKYLFDDETSFVGYGGAAFSGKSYLMCQWFTALCLAYPGIGCGLGRKELTTLKKTTLLTLFKVFDESGIDESFYNFNSQSNIITFFNGSQIFLIDMAYKSTDPLFTRLGGYELTVAGVDESNESQRQAILILSTRIGRRKNHEYGIRAKMLETFNPSKDHVYDRYYKPSVSGTMPKDYKFVKALPSDNPSPEVEEYVKRILLSGDTVTIERLIKGNFEYDDDPLVIMRYGKILEMFTNKFVEKGEPYQTCDIAYEGSDIFVTGIWDGLRLIKVIPRDKINDVHVPAWVNENRMTYKVPMGNLIYDADGLQKFTKQSTKTGHLMGAKEFHNNGKPIDPAYFNLKAECYFKLAELVENNQIFIEDLTYKDQIIQELEQIRKLVTDDTKIRLERKSDLKERLGRSPDFADMIMMRMLPLLKPKHRHAVGGSNYNPNRF